MTLPTDRLERIRAMEGTHFWSIGRDLLVDNLIDRFRMGPPFVDAGAGTGSYAALHASGWFWFDTGDVERGGVRASVTAMPFASGAAGTVLLRDLLEHVDERAALREVFRVLRPGGHVLVTVPGWPSLWGPRDELAGHLRRYRRRDLRRAVAQAGFQVGEIRGYQFVLLPVMMGVRALARITGDERPQREEVVGRLNRILTRINSFEAGLARRRWPAPPTGSSLVLVAVKP